MIEIDVDEQIVRVVRRHWFVLLRDAIVLLFLITIPVIVLFALHMLPVELVLRFSGSETVAGTFFLFFWLSVVWMIGWSRWTDYYLDVLIVTTKRVFDINQHGLFSRESSSFRIDRIQNVAVDQKGIISTLLDFGTLRVETAGEREVFVAPYISDPYEIKKFLNKMQDEALDRSQEVHFSQKAGYPGGAGGGL
jgi:uncharacterized membrane protein YdbT with pleckstrin-like domain